MVIKSFNGPDYPTVGRTAFDWAEANRDLDPTLWKETDRWDGGRIAAHPAGYQVRAWLSGSASPGYEVSAQLEAI